MLRFGSSLRNRYRIENLKFRFNSVAYRKVGSWRTSALANNSIRFMHSTNKASGSRFKESLEPWRRVAIASWVLIGSCAFCYLDTTRFAMFWLWPINLLMPETLSNFISEKASDFVGSTVQVTRIRPKWREGVVSLQSVFYSRLEPETVTHFRMNFKNIELKIDIKHWLTGFGWLEELRVEGLRCVVNRRHLDFTGVDPSEWLTRKTESEGDLHLKSLKLHDCFITILDYNDFRPYTVHIHQGLLNRFRTQWLLYDMFAAEYLTGEFDDCAFSLTRPRFWSGWPSVADLRLLPDYMKLPSGIHAKDLYRISKLKMSGINIDLLNTGTTGPFSWIQQGTVDVVSYLVFPDLNQIKSSETEEQNSNEVLLNPFETDDEATLNRLTSEIDELKDRLIDDVIEPLRQKLMDELRERRSILQDKIGVTGDTSPAPRENNNEADVEAAPTVITTAPIPKSEPELSFFTELRFHNIRASVPSEESAQLGVIPTTLIRPIVAYLNAQPTAPRGRKTATPPISTQFSIPVQPNFNGALTIYQCGFLDKVTEAVGVGLARMVVFKYSQYTNSSRKGPHKVPIYPDPSTTGAQWWSLYGDEEQDELSDDDTIHSTDLQNDGRAMNILSRVSWWSLQQASRNIWETWDWMRNVNGVNQPTPADPEHAGFLEMYNEILWGVSLDDMSLPDIIEHVKDENVEKSNDDDE